MTLQVVADGRESAGLVHGSACLRVTGPGWTAEEQLSIEDELPFKLMETGVFVLSHDDWLVQACLADPSGLEEGRLHEIVEELAYRLEEASSLPEH